ncbi:hypothetical protein D3C79_1096950 [compost metagenome]
MNEVMLIEAAELLASDAPGHGRDVIDIGFSDHRGHCRGDVAGFELVLDVLVPQV